MMKSTTEITNQIDDLERRLADAESQRDTIRGAIADALVSGADTAKLQKDGASLDQLLAAGPDALALLEADLRKAEAAEALAALEPEIQAAKKAEAAAEHAIATFFTKVHDALDAAYATADALKVAQQPIDPGIFFTIFGAISPFGWGQDPRGAFDRKQREIASNLVASSSAWSSRLMSRAAKLRAAADGIPEPKPDEAAPAARLRPGLHVVDGRLADENGRFVDQAAS
jgi:hypothetical protein